MSDKNSSVVGRIASAIYNTAKGAASGGLHGAAIGAVKSFLPELIKLATIILAVIILLPLLIFAALPNILFGYDNALAEDVIKLTDKAYSIDEAYKEVKNYSQAEVDKVVEEVKAKYTTEDGPEYDEVEVNANTENTNIYWFIAITSVTHQQDLYSMDEDSIKDMTIKKIFHSASIISTTSEDDEDSSEIIKTLKIDIEDLDPEELMKKLEFSDDERNWAKLLYSTLAEDQHVGVEDSDGAGYYNTNYGNIVFADASTPVVYYNQSDSRWGSIMYGRTGTIATSACGPTALAMVVASLKDRSVTPVEVAKWAVDNGYRCEGNGSYRTLIPEGGRHYGLTVEAIGRDAEKLVEALKDGKLVIAIMAAGRFTKNGHFIVLRGVTADGKVLVADSGSYNRSNLEWDLRIILNEASRKNGAGGPFWVLSA